MAQPREAPDDFRPAQRRAVTVVNVGGVDHGVDQIAFGVGEDMALAALDLLGRLIAPKAAAFRAFTLWLSGPGERRSTGWPSTATRSDTQDVR